MKMNIELNIDWFDGENYTINDAFKAEIISQLSEKAAEVIANNNFDQILKDAELIELKKEYKETINKLKEKERTQIVEMNENINKAIDVAYHKLMYGVAIKVDDWGQSNGETTVEQLIKDKIKRNVETIQKSIFDKIAREVQEQMKMSDYQLKTLIEKEVNKVKDENAKKIAEFVMKGISK